MGLTFNADGEFWMSFNDFKEELSFITALIHITTFIITQFRGRTGRNGFDLQRRRRILNEIIFKANPR